MGSMNRSALCEAELLPYCEGAKPGYLYRYFCADGELLYIGISLNAVARMGQHRGKPWFDRIASVTVGRYETYVEAAVAEARAIFHEGPIHNIARPRDKADLDLSIKKLRSAARRRGAEVPKRILKIHGMYNTDKILHCIPPETTFEQYLARPDYYNQRDDKPVKW